MMRTLRTWHTSRASTSLPSMSVIGSAQPDVVRIKVYKPNSSTKDDTNEPGSSKKFCIDPRLTTYQTLLCLIAQAFNIKTDFTIHAIHRCPTTGREHLQAIWSDWDLDASIQTVQPGSYLRLRYEVTNQDEVLDDWDFIGLNDFNSNIRWFNVDSRSIIATVNQTAGKAASALNKAINWMYGSADRNHSKPIGDGDMKKYLDNEGRLINMNELRQAIYEGGVEPSYRKIVWRHLLNIFPLNMTGLERIDYLKCIEIKYKTLKKRWFDDQHQNETTRTIMRTIEKDVLRTDRAYGFYGDEGEGYDNVQSLFHILTTYCISHPNIKYCQGMNDYASIIFYVMRDESLAYICFCSIMKRIRANFATDGVAIATKFHHLKVTLQAIDPVYWNYLESCDAVNLYFTYRWLLLECKREFPFNDALRVLEVMWATLPIDSEPPQLSEITLLTSPSDTMLADNLFTTTHPKPKSRSVSCPQLNIIDEDNLRKFKHRSSSLTPLNKDSVMFFLQKQQQQQQQQRESDGSVIIENDEYQSLSPRHSTTSGRLREKSLENSFSLSEISDFDCDNLTNTTTPSTTTTSAATAATTNPQLSTVNWLQRLPAGDTTWLEEDNLFLIFICVSLLLVHRNSLLKQNHLDEQEISMHFGRYRRRHNAEKILLCARTFYSQYIQWARKKRMLDDLNRFSAS